MDPIWRAAIKGQFNASITMLENAIRACPDELWRVRLWGEQSDRPDLAEFWYLTFHTLFWLDLYLAGSVDGFSPPEPFTLDELDPAGLVPEPPYSQAELLTYLEYDRRKMQNLLDELTVEQSQRLCKFPWGEVTFAGLLLDNMRHVQEHGAQLNMILGQKVATEPRWVAK